MKHHYWEPPIALYLFLGGLAGGIIGTVAIALIFGNRGIHIGWYVLLGAVLGVLCQFGDLAASMVKRHFGVKDFGHLLPGHGGLMDRLDSTIFILPVVWLFFLYTTGV